MGTMLVPHFLHNLENGAATSTDATEYTYIYIYKIRIYIYIHTLPSFFLHVDGATKIARLHGLIRFFVSCSLADVVGSRQNLPESHAPVRVNSHFFARGGGGKARTPVKIIQNKWSVSIDRRKKEIKGRKKREEEEKEEEKKRREGKKRWSSGRAHERTPAFRFAAATLLSSPEFCKLTLTYTAIVHPSPQLGYRACMHTRRALV